MDTPCRRAMQQVARLCIAILALAAGGAALSPLTNRLNRQQLEEGLHFPPPPIDRQDALSQQLTLFSLGGLRSLAAEIMALDATNAWIKRDWLRALRRWNSVTTLSPRRINYWISASRDMATNAAGDVANDRRLTEHEQAVQSRHFLDEGERFLLQGIANNPDSVLLHIRLGDLYSDLYRRPRFSKAVEAYRKAAELGAPPLYQRQEFYNLCRIRGREQEAWELGKRLFEDSRNRVPSVRTLLFVLQNKIGLPEDERFSVEQLFGSRERAARQMKIFLDNRLRYPTNGIREFLQEYQQESGEPSEKSHADPDPQATNEAH